MSQVYKVEVVNEVGNAAMFFTSGLENVRLLQSHYLSSIIKIETLDVDNFDTRGIPFSDVRVIMDFIYSDK